MLEDDALAEVECGLASTDRPCWRQTGSADLASDCDAVGFDALQRYPAIARWRATRSFIEERADGLACLEQAHAGHVALEQPGRALLDARMALVLCVIDVAVMDRLDEWFDRSRLGALEEDVESQAVRFWLHAGRVAQAVLGGSPLQAASLSAAWLADRLRPLRDAFDAVERVLAAQLLLNLHAHARAYEQLDFVATLVETDDVMSAVPPVVRARWLYNIGFAHYHRTKMARAEAAWRSMLEVTERFRLPQSGLMASLAILRLFLDQGRLNEARALEADVDPRWGPGRASQLIELQQMRGRLHLLSGQPSRAEACLQEALDLSAKEGLTLTERSSCHTDFCQVLIARGRTSDALALLQTLYERLEGRDAEVHLCLHELLRAMQLRYTDAAESRRLLASALDRARREQYMMFFRLLPHLASQVCDVALRWNVEAEFAREAVVERRLPASPESDETWPWPVFVTLLGHVDVRWHGAALKRDEPKSRELLSYLASRKQMIAGFNDTACTLWPDSDDDGRVLDQTIYRLRKLLEDESLVMLRNRRLWLDPTRVNSEVNLRSLLIARIESAVMSAPPTVTHGLFEECIALFARFAALRGPLFAGHEAPWIMALRTRCRREGLRMKNVGIALMERAGASAAQREMLAAILDEIPLEY